MSVKGQSVGGFCFLLDYLHRPCTGTNLRAPTLVTLEGIRRTCRVEDVPSRHSRDSGKPGVYPRYPAYDA